jgi:hypothetical protein
MYSLIESIKLNSRDPRLYIINAFPGITDHSTGHIADLCPWTGCRLQCAAFPIELVSSPGAHAKRAG